MNKAAFQAMWENAPRLNPKAQGARVTVNLPHRGTPDLVEAVLPLWLNQSVPVVVDVVDTGSDPAQLDLLRDVAARNEDMRLHTIQPRIWKHPSEPIAIACEFSQLYADTEYVLFSHVDVFPHSRVLVHWLMNQCNAECPVVGYEISPRDHVVGYLAKHWEGMVGHSLTMVYMPSIRTAGIRWPYNEMDLCGFFNWKRSELAGWDTEVSFNLWLKHYGIEPKIVGHDRNLEHLVDEWHGHARSYPGSLLFGHEHVANAAGWIAQEVAEVSQRVRDWQATAESSS